MTRISGCSLPELPHRHRQVHRTVGALLAMALLAAATFAASMSTADAGGYSTTLAEVSDRISATPLSYQGITGAGIDVAVIDTGVEPVPGLDGYDKLIIGPDLSFEAGVPEFYGRDTYGHGTAMASIIAGNDGAGYQGVAPGARILSMKVADNTGAVDVTQVIAALDWVVEHGQSNGLNVRIINLSYVTDSDQAYEIDPLAFAVERAWRAGYVVVVAAGNAGAETSILGNPATDPYVISVAASDGSGAADFTSHGSTTRMPDVLAPGDRILGLAAPDSRLVQDHPSAFIDGRYLRGSGTSQSTAIVSGAAALLLEDRPELTPDQVKALLILGTVDDNGVGRASSLDPIRGLSEFFDLMDAQADLLEEAGSLQSQAAELRARAKELSGDVVLLQSESAVLVDAQTKLESQAQSSRGFAAARLEGQLEEVRLDTDVITDKAVDLGDEASALEQEALKLEAKAEELLTEAERLRIAAEQVPIPEHMRQLETSQAEQRLAEELTSQQEQYSAEAASLREKAESLRKQARILRFQVEPIRLEPTPIEPILVEPILVEPIRVDTFSLYRSSDEIQWTAPVQEIRLKAPVVVDSSATKDAISDLWATAQALDVEAAALDSKSHELKKELKEALSRSDEAATLAQMLKAKHDEAMALVFDNWNGTGLGAIDFDPRGGAGHIDIERSAAMESFGAVQSHPESTGNGSIEAARGSNHVTLPDGSRLEGEITFAGSDWTGSTWTGSTWTGSTWTGSTWTGSTWTGSTWTGSTWTGSTWTGSTWTGSTWTGSTWTGSTWTGSNWG